MVCMMLVEQTAGGPQALPETGRTVTVVTLGQAPRSDVVPAMARAFGDRITTAELGALDHASEAEIADLAPTGEERAVVTRTRDGSQVVLSKARLLPRLVDALERAAAMSDAVVVLCSGEFEDFNVSVPVIYPDRVLRGLVGGLLGAGATLGVITPLAAQAVAAQARWSPVASAVATATASPYQHDDEILHAARRLSEARPGLVVLDCMGFATRHRGLVRPAVGCAVLLPSVCVAAVAGEVFA